MKAKLRLKVWTIGELREQTPRDTGIKVTKSRKALTLRWGKWKKAPYDIPLEGLRTERGILKWTLHLAEKSWVSREQIQDFIEAALKVSGIDIHNEPKRAAMKE
jgi:hypothetical protein